MRKITYDSQDEKNVLIGMIVSDKVLAQINHIWTKEGLFSSQWMNKVGNWCISHHERYTQAPGKHIEAIVAEWAQRQGSTDPASVEVMDRFLCELNEVYKYSDEDINPQFLMDKASKVFNKVKAKTLINELQDALEEENLDSFYAGLSSHRKIEVGTDSFTDVFEDGQAIDEMFEQSDEPIIKFPKTPDLDRFFGSTFCRDALVAFLAPEKRGKSIFLQEVCLQALRNRRKVVMFQVGDMSRSQIMRRLSIRTSNRPFRNKSIMYPVSLERSRKQVVVTREEKTWDTPMTKQEAHENFKKWQKRHTRATKNFMLHCSAAETMTVERISSLLDQLYYQDNFAPDVICVDYADLLTTTRATKDVREKTNEIWVGLRRIAQQRNCLLLTATQANSDSYDQSSMSMRNFSEDKRKNAHCNAIVAINQTNSEKAEGIYRLGHVVLREDEFHINRQCYVASCLGICNPFVLSLM